VNHANRHSAHSGHDETLVVRLYGDDVSAVERDRARALVSDCEECAALFADLAAGSDVLRAMPVPPRPRDFSLIDWESEAGRGGRRGRIAGLLSGQRFLRSLGAAVATLGLAGVVVTSALAITSPVTTTALDAQSRTAFGLGSPNAEGAGGGGAVPAQGPTAAPAMPSPAATAAASQAAASHAAASSAAAGGGEQTAIASPSSGSKVADQNVTGGASSATPIPAGGAGGQGDGTGSTGIPAANDQVDLRWAWPIAFGLVALLGVLLLIGPALRRRAAGRRS
jgi:hypothetical protein